MLQLSLDPDSALPLADQIVLGIRTRIEDRVLRPGMRLPPIRDFAERHAVSRYTVMEAYDRLVAMGYARSRRGSGFYIEDRPQPAVAVAAKGELAQAFGNAGLLHRVIYIGSFSQTLLGHVFRPQMQPSPFLRCNVAYAQDPRLEDFLDHGADRGAAAGAHA